MGRTFSFTNNNGSIGLNSINGKLTGGSEANVVIAKANDVTLQANPTYKQAEVVPEIAPSIGPKL